MKQSRVYLLLVLAIAAFTLFGCGGGGGGGGGAVGTGITFQENTGAIKGKITSNGIISESQKGSILSDSGVVGVPGAEVFLESDTSKKTVSDAEGNFILENVPEGTHNVISRKESDGKSYKMRSGAIVVVKLQIVEIQSITIVAASNSVSGKISKPNGDPVQGVTVKVWDQVSTSDSNGNYQVFNMPAGSWEVSFKKDGFTDFAATLSFGVGQVTNFNLVLSPVDSTQSQPTTPQVLAPPVISNAIVKNDNLHYWVSWQTDIDSRANITLSMTEPQGISVETMIGEYKTSHSFDLGSLNDNSTFTVTIQAFSRDNQTAKKSVVFHTEASSVNVPPSDPQPSGKTVSFVSLLGSQASKPTVDGTNIYVHFEGGYLVCFDTTKDALSWSFKSEGQFGDGYFGVIPGCQLGDINGDGTKDVVVPLRGLMTAIDGKTHTALWEVSAGGDMACAPAVTDLNGDGYQDAVFGTVNTLYAINGKTGQTLWSKSMQAVHSDILALDIDNDGKKEIIACGTHGDDKIYALKPSDGSQIWTVQMNNKIESGPVFKDVDNDGIIEIFIGSHEPSIVCVNSRTGSFKWRLDTSFTPYEGGWEAGVIHSRLNLEESNGNFYLVAPSKCDRLFCLNAKTGAIVWKRDKDVADWYWGGVGFYSAGAEKYVVVPNFNDKTVKFQSLLTGEVKEIFSSGGESFSNYSMPVSVNSRVYLPTNGKMLVIK